MGHSVVRTESQQNHLHSSEISPKRGTTFLRQRQFTSNKINELIHVRQRKVLKMSLIEGLPSPITYGKKANPTARPLGARTMAKRAAPPRTRDELRGGASVERPI